MNYTLVYEHKGRAWLAHVREVPGCHTHGRTVEQARERIREALSLWVDRVREGSLREEIRLPGEARKAIRRSQPAREKADRSTLEAKEATSEAVRALTKKCRLSMRDAGELLGLSHQRIHQLVGSGRTGR